MVRAGEMPLDRAHAHASWAERYDAQGETQRAAAHFGRAMHYTQMALTVRTQGQAFGARRAVMLVHRPANPPTPPTAYALESTLDELYRHEWGGIRGIVIDTVHHEYNNMWYIHRGLTGALYLVPQRLAKDKEAAKSLVQRLTDDPGYENYKSVVDEGLLIVQDRRERSVRVKRNGGEWEAASDLETFVYFNFVLRHPLRIQNYHSEKGASELRDRMSSGSERQRDFFESRWTTIPREYSTNENEDIQLTIKRDRSGIYIGNFGDAGENMSQISDVAYRIAPAYQIAPGGEAQHTERRAGARNSDLEARGAADPGDIVVGLWDNGEEAWYSMNGGNLKRRQPKQSWPGDDASSNATPRRSRRKPTLPAHRELEDMIEDLYESESSGIMDSVHRGSNKYWSIYRCFPTGSIYLVPTSLAADEEDVRQKVQSLIRYTGRHDNYKRVLTQGLLIVQDYRAGCVRVKSSKDWEPATEIETFAYYDFLLRQPLEFHVYVGANEASDILSPVNSKRSLSFLSRFTPIPAHLQDEESRDLRITLSCKPGGIIYVGDHSDNRRKQISDVAYRYNVSSNKSKLPKKGGKKRHGAPGTSTGG